MTYGVKQLAVLAGVSVRTLHYYDEIGILKPAYIQKNGYREYGEKELLTLQQILFFRELDFPLETIRDILKSPKFKMKDALRDHRKLILLKQKRLSELVQTIDKTIKKLNKQKYMNDNELYDGFDSEQMKEYAEEAKQRWGNTEAYKESQKRVAKMSKDDMARIKKAGEDLTREIAEAMPLGHTHPKVQELILRHFNGIKVFYEPSYEMYRGLGNMYVGDSRFTAYYEKYAKGLAVFMRDAMIHYADTHEKK